MYLNERQKELNYERFERDLLQVLKNDREHRIPFDRKLAFKSRRYNCLLAAADVRLDSETGELVMVGAFKSGDPIVDSSKGYPVMKSEVEIPLRECFDDLKFSSGMEDKLLNKAKKAVIDKYVTGYVNSFERKGIVGNRRLVFDEFGLEEFKINHSTVMEINRDGDDVIVTSGNSFNPRFDTKVSRFTLCEMQELGFKLQLIDNMYKDAMNVYLARKKQLEPLSMTYSEGSSKKHTEDALVTMYRKNFPISICNSIATNLAGSDMFDLTRHTIGEISELVSGYDSPRPAKRQYRAPSI